MVQLATTALDQASLFLPAFGADFTAFEAVFVERACCAGRSHIDPDLTCFVACLIAWLRAA